MRCGAILLALAASEAFAYVDPNVGMSPPMQGNFRSVNMPLNFTDCVYDYEVTRYHTAWSMYGCDVGHEGRPQWWNDPYPHAIRSSSCDEATDYLGGTYSEDAVLGFGNINRTRCSCHVWRAEKDIRREHPWAEPKNFGVYTIWYGTAKEWHACQDDDAPVCPSIEEFGPIEALTESVVWRKLDEFGWVWMKHEQQGTQYRCQRGCETSCDSEDPFPMITGKQAKLPPALVGEWYEVVSDTDHWKKGCGWEIRSTPWASAWHWQDVYEGSCNYTSDTFSAWGGLSTFKSATCHMNGEDEMYGRLLETIGTAPWCYCTYYTLTSTGKLTTIFGFLNEAKLKNDTSCADVCPDTTGPDWFVPISKTLKYGGSSEFDRLFAGDFTCGTPEVCGEEGRMKVKVTHSIMKNVASACECQTACEGIEQYKGQGVWTYREGRCLCIPPGTPEKKMKKKRDSKWRFGTYETD